jgi:hypothetical protein
MGKHFNSFYHFISNKEKQRCKTLTQGKIEKNKKCQVLLSNVTSDLSSKVVKLFFQTLSFYYFYLLTAAAAAGFEPQTYHHDLIVLPTVIAAKIML